MRERKVAPSGSRYILCTYSYVFLFSHELIATVQSVVTGQAPITLERKITSGGKQIKTRKKQKIIQAITETNHIPPTKIKRCDQRTYYLSRYVSYAKRVAAETEAEETA